ncbi:MAG TPA: YlxR family protein [Thermomicrobiales bacterium]|nr:YlxR family protein [Thermomicrobiales bacterium]
MKGRPKHVPQRTCVACRETGAKRGLIRLVRTPEGTVEVDPTGKRNGRGAYLCARMSCWRRGVDERVLGRALRLERLTDENRQALLTYADERVPEDELAAVGDQPAAVS